MNLSRHGNSGFSEAGQLHGSLIAGNLRKQADKMNYEVKLAQEHELEELFCLRYDVFLASHDTQPITMKDVDQYDALADHLIVKADNRIIATYRLLPTDRVLAAGLIPYSANEFNLSSLLEVCDPRATVELGRSCVHPAHRNGNVPKLLWSALAKYMMAHGRSDAFGSVSVFNVTHLQANGLVGYFKSQGVWSDSIECPALTPVCADTSLCPNDLRNIVPPLLRTYLMLGAKLYGGPSHDPVFRSHDFLIHFSTRTMTDRCRRSFFNHLP